MDAQAIISAIAAELKVSPSEIKIADSKDGLYMVNPVEATNADVVSTPGIRGSVWKVVKEEFGETVKPIYGSLGYSKEIVADQIIALGNNVMFYNAVTRKTEIQEMTIERITASNEGIVYRATPDGFMKHDRLDATKSKWGRAQYSTIFTSLGLPSIEEIYADSPKDVSHVFMACHKYTVTGTRQIFKDDFGYIVYLGAVDAESRLVPEKALKFKQMDYEDFPVTVDENLGIIHPVELTLLQANDYLSAGFYTDISSATPKLKTGESVILHLTNGERVKVISSSFDWRNRVRNSNPSIPHQYYSLVFEAWNEKEFTESYMNLSPGSVGNLRKFIESGKHFVWAEQQPWTAEQLNRLRTDSYERARVIYFNLLLAIPPGDQLENSGLYDDFITKTERLISFLHAYRKHSLQFVDLSKFPVVEGVKEEDGKYYTYTGGVKCEHQISAGTVYRRGADGKIRDITGLKVVPGKSLVFLAEPHPRVKFIVTQAVNFASKEINKMGRVSDQKYNEMLTKNFRYLLNNERFNTRYQMTRQCEAWDN